MLIFLVIVIVFLVLVQLWAMLDLDGLLAPKRKPMIPQGKIIVRGKEPCIVLIKGRWHQTER